MRARGVTVWITGLSGSGKTTTAHALRERFVSAGRTTFILDGDELRGGVSSDLGFSASDRAENVRRTGEVALLAALQGHVAIVALISPRNDSRQLVRGRHHDNAVPFLEVYLSTPIETCESRDPKSLYKRARAGTNPQFTGVGDPYEAPTSPDIAISTASTPPEQVAQIIFDRVVETAWRDV